MKQQKSKDPKRLLDLYNMLVNLFWSVPSLLPLTIYCYRYVPIKELLAFLLPALLCLFLPNAVYNKMKASNTTAFYKRLGVDLVNRFSQNGIIIHRLVRKRFPGYKAVRYNAASINRLLSQTYLFEKFHFATAVFFVLLTLQAFVTDRFGWVVAFIIINVFYNVYPILFQQYVRLKLRPFTKSETKQETKPMSYTSCRLFLRSLR